MTQYEFLQAVAKANISEEMTEHAKEEMVKIETRRNKAAENRAERREKDKILVEAMLEGAKAAGKGYLLASQFAEALNISSQKASALARRLVSEKVFKEANFKTTKGPRKGYTLIED